VSESGHSWLKVRNNRIALMSALGQKQTYAVHQPMSALPPIATAKADLSQTAMSTLPLKADIVRVTRGLAVPRLCCCERSSLGHNKTMLSMPTS